MLRFELVIRVTGFVEISSLVQKLANLWRFTSGHTGDPSEKSLLWEPFHWTAMARLAILTISDIEFI